MRSRRFDASVRLKLFKPRKKSAAKKTRKTLAEADLYPPIKELLEKQGYEVKSEIGAVDVMAIRNDEAPVIVELKTAFSLTLMHQAIDRLSMSDQVYVAVFYKTGKAFQKALRANKKLCRRLGIGLMTVHSKTKAVEVHLDPGPYAPRKSKAKTTRLLKEFQQRVGDPNTGGQTNKGLITSYRQNALKCLVVLCHHGPLKASEVKSLTAVETARNIMSHNHYGWFERIDRGIYALSPVGLKAITEYKDAIGGLELEAA